MRLIFSGRAEREDSNNAKYLEERSPSAAVKYGEDLKRLLALLKDNPHMGVMHADGRTRSIPLKGFPFLVFYRIRADELLVLSIFHTVRNPDKRPGPTS